MNGSGAADISFMNTNTGPGQASAFTPFYQGGHGRDQKIQGDIFELTMMCAGGTALGARRDETGANIEAMRRGQDSALPYFNFRKTLIYAGSNEIQRNIIAKAVLGL